MLLENNFVLQGLSRSKTVRSGLPSVPYITKFQSLFLNVRAFAVDIRPSAKHRPVLHSLRLHVFRDGTVRYFYVSPVPTAALNRAVVSLYCLRSCVFDVREDAREFSIPKVT